MLVMLRQQQRRNLMSDTPQSPEAVAFALMSFIYSNDPERAKKTDQKSVLELYISCVKAVRHEASPKS